MATGDGDVTVVFLDANIIAKPVTRTILMIGGLPSGFRSVWSATAEAEAARHMRPRAVAPAQLRERLGLSVSPTGQGAGRFTGTGGADRQILADAAAAGARFIVTEDVDDYGLDDLSGAGISAVNPDLFLAERLTRNAYSTVIELFVERQVDPPTTAAGFHSALARQHPRLFAAHADLFDVSPAHANYREPDVIFRGSRCLRCDRVEDDPEVLIDGLGPECR